MLCLTRPRNRAFDSWPPPHDKRVLPHQRRPFWIVQHGNVLGSTYRYNQVTALAGTVGADSGALYRCAIVLNADQLDRVARRMVRSSFALGLAVAPGRRLPVATRTAPLKGRGTVKITIELTRPTWLRRPRSRKGLTILLAVLLTLGIPAGVYASDRFTDVPSDSIFHNAINSIAGAGITLGCGGTNYCPSANVTREQMAAFLQRGLGRAAGGPYGNVGLTATYSDLSVLTIKAGEVPGGTVFIKLDGYVASYTTNVAGCPCQTVYYIALDGGGGSFNFFNQLTTLGSSGYALDTGAVGWVVALPSGTTLTFRLRARVFGGANHNADGQLFALMVPFGSQGTSAP
jgi:S-layer homology domain